MADLNNTIQAIEHCANGGYCIRCKLRDDRRCDAITSCKTLLTDALELLKADKQKWVPVSERLPEEKINPITQDYTEVVCYTFFGDVRVYKFGDGHFYKNAGIMDSFVSHWQYLPTPPKAGEQE